MLCVSGFELYSCWVPLNTNQVGGGFHWKPAMFDNPADVKCCFSIFCTISVNERGDAKLLWHYFSNKIYSAVVSCELLPVPFIMLFILYIRWFSSFELLCEWNPMERLFKWAIWGAIKTYMPTLPYYLGVSRIQHQSLLYLTLCVRFSVFFVLVSLT